MISGAILEFFGASAVFLLIGKIIFEMGYDIFFRFLLGKLFRKLSIFEGALSFCFHPSEGWDE